MSGVVFAVSLDQKSTWTAVFSGGKGSLYYVNSENPAESIGQANLVGGISDAEAVLSGRTKLFNRTCRLRFHAEADGSLLMVATALNNGEELLRREEQADVTLALIGATAPTV